MFTEESFQGVRQRLSPNGVLVIYNYFRERWLVDRLANTAAAAFGEEPHVHVHEARAYLGVLMAGPRLKTLTHEPRGPRTGHGLRAVPRSQPGPTAAAGSVDRAGNGRLALPLHETAGAAEPLSERAGGGARDFPRRGDATLRGEGGRFSWFFFLLGAGFMLLETKSIIQFALLWGSTWIVASLSIAAVLTMALVANFIVARVEIVRPWLVGSVLVALLAVSYAVPIGRITFASRAVESIFYSILVFSPVLCAGLLFGSAIKRSTTLRAGLWHATCWGRWSAAWLNICPSSPDSTRCS